jgi:hypothetical protein
MISKSDLLKREKDDRFIYHYTQFDSAEKILSNRNLLFNRLTEMNDPFEFMRYIHDVRYEDFLSSYGTIDFKESEKINRFKDNVNTIIKRQYRICSFCIDYEGSADNKYVPYMNKGFSRSRMWSQYGEDHKGVCLIFNREKMIETITKNYKDVFAQEIFYNDDLSESFDATKITGEVLEKSEPIEWVNKHIAKYLFLKFEDYKNEHEYRIAVHYAQNEDLFIDFNDEIEGVILGQEITPKHKEIIQRLSVNFNFPVFKFHWLYGSPNSFLEKIN